MKIFVTGATGFIGYAVSAELARAGHTVYGLARSPEKAASLSASEILPVIGDMSKPESYLETARDCQVLVHCAAEYSPRYMELDKLTVAALLDAAASTSLPRRFIYTSGCWLYGNTGNDAVDESSPLNPPAFIAPRMDTEQLVLDRSTHLLRTLVLRPGCVYGGEGSLTAAWFDSAVKEGASRIVSHGNFRWTMVHFSDLAQAYRLAVESDCGREVFNISDRSRFTVLECARAASLVANGSANVNSTSVEEAATAMGPLAECLAFNQHIDASKAMRLLGWNPRHGGFVDGVPRYYESWRASRAT